MGFKTYDGNDTPPWFHEEGIRVPAVILAITPQPSTRDGWKDQFMWEFTIDGEQYPQRAWTGQEIGHPKAKATKWCLNLFGSLENVPATLDGFKGLGVDLAFENYTNAAGDIRQKVVNVWPRQLTDEEQATQAVKDEFGDDVF